MGDDTGDTDDLILKLLTDNDPKAVSLLFNAYYGAVSNRVSRIIGDRDEAQDIVLQLFQAVWEKRHALNISKPIKSYLLIAAHNRSVNHIRNRGRARLLLNNAIQRSAVTKTVPPADAEIEARELDELIRVAIGLLPDKPRVTLVMSRDSGMTYKEIATNLGVTEKAVEKNINKALQLLRVMLKPYLRMLRTLL